MKKKSTYEIELPALKEGSNEFDFKVGKELFELMDNNDILSADVDVRLEIRRRGDMYDCHFEMDGELIVPCDRCLDPMPVEVGADYDIVVRYGEEFDDSSDELLILPYNRTTLDVAPMIYDTLMLSIPLRCVHEDGGCNPEISRYLSDSSNEEEI